MIDFLAATTLLLVLLNPFLTIVYLVDLVRGLSARRFAAVLIRAGVLTAVVYVAFGLLGDFIFARFFQSDPASFKIFGGLVFLIIGIRYVLQGNSALESLRATAPNLASAIALPILIGPGTISACIVIGKRLPPAQAMLAILGALAVTLIAMMLMKLIHDAVARRFEPVVEHYFEIAGRVAALFVGTVAVQMIMSGIGDWLVLWRAANPA